MHTIFEFFLGGCWKTLGQCAPLALPQKIYPWLADTSTIPSQLPAFILCSISRDLEGIQGFTELRELILDGNEIGDDVIFPVLEYIHTLTMNKNKVSLNIQDPTLVSKNPPSHLF